MLRTCLFPRNAVRAFSMVLAILGSACSTQVDFATATLWDPKTHETFVNAGDDGDLSFFNAERCPAVAKAEARQPGTSEFEKHDHQEAVTAAWKTCRDEFRQKVGPTPKIGKLRLKIADVPAYDFEKHGYPIRIGSGDYETGKYVYSENIANFGVSKTSALFIIKQSLLEIEEAGKDLVDGRIFFPVDEKEARLIGDRLSAGGLQLELAFAPKHREEPLPSNRSVLSKIKAMRVVNAEGAEIVPPIRLPLR